MKSIKLGQLQFQKKSKRKAGEGETEGAYKFFTSSQLQKKFVNEYDFTGPALIFGTGGSASIHYCEEQFSTSTDCFVLKSTDPEIDLKYVGYFLKGNIHLLVEGFKGAGLEHISKEYLSEIQIPLPSNSEQKAIIKKLDKIVHLMELKEESIRKTEELTKSIFLEMFGDPMINEMKWELLTVEKICERIVDCPHSTPIFEKQGKYCMDTTCIKPGVIDFKKIRFVSDETFQKRNLRMIPKAGDVLFSREGALLGIAAIIPEGVDLCLGQRIMIFRLNHDIMLSEYFEFVFNSNSFKLSYKGKIGGSASPHLNISDIRKLTMPTPPLLLQKSFAKVLQANRVILDNQQKSLVKIENLFNGLVQTIFHY